MKEKLVLIGNGMAGIRTLDEILKRTPGRYEISVIGEEPYPVYDRILLSSLLSGAKSEDEITIHDLAWYEKNGIRLYKGTEALSINRAEKTIHTSTNITLGYDKVILATGSNAVVLNVPGSHLTGVLAFRSLDDVKTMLSAAKRANRAIVIGGGLLGLEAAYGLTKQGLTATVVHLGKHLLDRQLDETAGEMLKQYLSFRGIRIMTSTSTQELIGDSNGSVRAIRFSDGEECPADLVVMAVGIQPRIELAREAGLKCNRGILVDDYLQTSDPDIFAMGECVEHRSLTYGLVAPLYGMAKTCAQVLASDTDPGRAKIAPYAGSLTSTKLKVTGIEVFSAGDHIGKKSSENIVFQDHSSGIYRKLILENNKITGIIMYGDSQDSSWYFNLLQTGQDITPIRDRVIFGRLFAADQNKSPSSPASLLTEEMEVCGCNGVCKGTIMQAIRELKLSSLEEVRAHTKASASCGNCTGLVKDILAATAGVEIPTTPHKEVLCKCTDYSAHELRQVMREEHIASMSKLMERLQWRTPDGCHICRPALNYYLLSEFPGEYQDDRQSRFVNERLHANIQRDGTYSVVPRIWGGITTPDQLRAIADAAEKYNIPTLKITGGQRIDLLGVRKENLPEVWRDLGRAGLVSGHAYGKALRTVKTCVGSEWCRFGVQDSTRLGIRMEEMSWGTWTPAKVKMAASGCPRNCAEVTIKDFGVIGVDSGWDIYVGGNGGIKVRVAELLCKVKTQEEVLEYCAAFLQLYRKTALYKERTAHWIERVGLDYIKEILVNTPQERARLHQEFLESQKHFQKDPWAELGQGKTDALGSNNEFSALSQSELPELSATALEETPS